jgi:hypothetical protein
MELAFFNVAILFTAGIPLFFIAPAVPNLGFMKIMVFYGLYTLFCLGAIWFLGRNKGDEVAQT